MLKKLGKIIWRLGYDMEFFHTEYKAQERFKELYDPMKNIFIETVCCKGAIIHSKCDVCGEEITESNWHEVNEDQYAEMSAERLRRRLDAKV